MEMSNKSDKLDFEDLNGTDVAQTLMRPLVQNTLNAFHNTGNLVSGFQRYLDIVELSNDGNCIIESDAPFTYEKDMDEYKIHPLQLAYHKLMDHVEAMTSGYPDIPLFHLERQPRKSKRVIIPRELPNLTSENNVYTIKLKNLYEHRLSLWEFGSYFGSLLVALSHEFDNIIVVKRKPKEIHQVLKHTWIGLPGIRSVTEITPQKYITLGSNFEELTQYFFNVRTSCIKQVFEVYGIKKAKKAIIQELLDIVGIEYKKQVEFVANKMCWQDPETKKWELLPITFTGHVKLNKGFIANMAFENSWKVLKDAAKERAVDECTSNAARIIFGKYGG
ncbi:beta and beta-prime subunits of DNA dependent RNA-polymerase [Conidiobolus coronatus NRRL 28638]|uniref:Beta and beta-prime subunits of DNA dependent RNA-polymerase n=1 Tax=Conidiobolus coronatus (strain ATCC 28846 / CBS 209.66 / NRRL 28638) TaxID=796925 RepID=A0A137NST1_CONC2|nr:beta and beta-prime subunits of DNA dependent RNA-polymerase [Conidiobolus coronatus NRRL 28638]|eukprot:KXN65837.1 beta and beta-prime subunits of DNA dependent RNA-polymerase [Conidiobolus coronatus NRRL 28638]